MRGTGRTHDSNTVSEPLETLDCAQDTSGVGCQRLVFSCITRNGDGAERDSLVRELQFLKVADCVSAVVHPPGWAMENRHASVNVGRHRVVGKKAAVHSRVHICRRRCRLQNFTHDLQLARIDRARKQPRTNLVQAVNREQLGSAVHRAHADAHIQPGVAVEIVVTEVAANGVATGAANDDFSTQRDVDDRGVEGHRRNLGRSEPQQVGKTSDQPEIL